MRSEVSVTEWNEAQGDGPAQEKMAGIERHGDDTQCKVPAGDQQSLAQGDQLFFGQLFFHGSLDAQEYEITEGGCISRSLITELADAYII